MDSPARARRFRPAPRLVSLLVGGAAAILVLYPIAFLLQASLSVGDPQARPPEAYGLDNYADLPRYGHIFANVIPLMRRRGFSEAEVHAILVDNPRRLLTLAAGPT